MQHTAIAAKEDVGTETRAFLGVERSVTGKRWRVRATDERLAVGLAQRLDVPEAVGRILAARGIGFGEAEAFLRPTLRDLLPDPSRLAGMDAAARRIADAVAGGESVAVFADYDVDGATSAALLHRFFASVGRDLTIYVPDRLNEGYGPTAEALLALHRGGASLVVTVDCGITAFEALDAAAAAGLDVIVADHHAAEGHLPPAVAVVNPNRLDDTSGLRYLAAIGVTFLLVVAVNRVLRERGYYVDRPEPDLRQWLDLVALGSVCDCVPLVGINRAFVAQGLKVMAQWNNAGLYALAQLVNLDTPPGAHHAGFIFGPRINAGGRVGQAGLGARLLACDDGALATAMAQRLDQANRARQEIEAAVLQDAMARIVAAGQDRDGSPVVVVAGEGWHPGVIGIVASRLVERLALPVCVVALGKGVGTGSGRSVPGADLGAAVIAARQAGLLVRGGGHPMAAGFSVPVDQIEALQAFLSDRLAAAVDAANRAPALGVDGAISVGGASPSLVSILARVGPFGIGNPEPRFVIPGARLAHVSVVGADHVRCVLTDPGGARLDAIAFRVAGEPLGRALSQGDGGLMHVAGRLRLNTWNGCAKSQLLIDDVAPVAS